MSNYPRVGARGDDLPGDAFVLRGGSDMSVLHLTDRFLAYGIRRRAQGLPEEYSLSVNSIPGLSVNELAIRANLLHAKVRVSTVEALSAVGFMVEPSPGRQDSDGHCSVYLARGRQHVPNGVELARFGQAFGAPIPNAGQRTRKEEDK